jgi:hypothetical protein
LQHNYPAIHDYEFGSLEKYVIDLVMDLKLLGYQISMLSTAWTVLDIQSLHQSSDHVILGDILQKTDLVRRGRY